MSITEAGAVLQEKMLSSSQAMEYLEERGYPISPQYFSKLVKVGRIRPAIKARRLSRYYLRDVKAYADERDELERLKETCWTTTQVAEHLGYSYHGVRLVLRELEVPAIHTKTGRVFYDPEEVEKAIERNRARIGIVKSPGKVGRPPGSTKKKGD